MKLFRHETYRRVITRAYMPEIDGLRFLAIFPVIIAHLIVSIVRNGPYVL